MSGRLAGEAATLAATVAHSERALGRLPTRACRTAEEQAAADSLLESAREARDAFVDAHAAAIYDALTHDRSRPLTLSPLVLAAAEAFPGLVPTARQLAEERARRQADKDGLEIDQGIFFRGLLRVPEIGEHLIWAMRRPGTAAASLLPSFQATGRLDLGRVLLERRGEAAHLTFNNDQFLNAEDDELVEAMETAVDLALLDPQVRVGVLRGGPVRRGGYDGRRVFSAGLNLRHLRDGRISFVDFLLRRELGCVHKMIRGLAHDRDQTRTSVTKPWIAAVDSFAIGGGLQLLLVMDRVIAADDSWFSLPAAKEGIVPGIANMRLPRAVGARLARRMILGGERLHAKDPEARLICDQVVAPQDMDSAIEDAVRDLASPAVAANRAMLSLAEEPLTMFREYLAEFAVVQARRLYSADVLRKVGAAWNSPASKL
ncbi:(3,5-dihydroxyphenyl)acetyl-CoA 1,2-dioxygenase DpgC [Verrucosispora sp. WMMD573]|uniref:(3,5-dihydroxyphenyl)acetyl-CoA 1,2-dioxygenase DpgC n=1 Tax=Verrucosispora sp. WMMD573 TaxID=3015149 RepID=UPI00248BC52C|nr:(3,5-dihydroxyphenyl)acetyl-CoA 1,2-dioxygenase DpgC [Verrucosispora sp. WMMD573]WBB53714.1 enoyl-CoA hydratase/isomerase family protein [Verrucosispora sp. WMMD573]